MAVEQSGAKVSPGQAGPAGPAAQAGDKPPAAELPEEAKADLEELKRKFREALDRYLTEDRSWFRAVRPSRR